MTKTKDETRPSVHVSIDVPELDAGLRFYGEVFGFVEKGAPFSGGDPRRQQRLPCPCAKGTGTS
ncbi:MAG: hypothetical protein U0235_00810 [Polyangiaceae bacterium]